METTFDNLITTFFQEGEQSFLESYNPAAIDVDAFKCYIINLLCMCFDNQMLRLLRLVQCDK